ncbi:MAG: hypothetical protein IJU16_03890, partial [Clostridia bacterium]|nr:hypothetical protein [Clostridia bacterium]
TQNADMPGNNGAALLRTDASEIISDALAIIKANAKVGDLNADGVINMKDYALLKKYVAGAADDDFYASITADTDGNGIVNMADAFALYRAASGQVALTDDQQTLADIDGNGIVNIADAFALYRQASGQ